MNSSVLLLAAMLTVDAPAGRVAAQSRPGGPVADPPELANMLRQVQSLAGAGKYDEAISVQERILAYRARTAGPDSLPYGGALLFMAHLHTEKGELVPAIALGRRALAIKEAKLGRWDWNVTGTRQLVARWLLDNQDVAGAEPMLEDVVQGFQHRDPGSLDVAAALGDLAASLLVLHRSGEAERHLRRALEIEESKFGRDSPQTANDSYRLASLLVAKTDYVGAEPLLRHAVASFRAAPGHERKLAQALNSQGEVLARKGNYSAAEASFREALAICETKVPAEDPLVTFVLTNLGSVLMSERRFPDAEELLLRSMEIDAKVFQTKGSSVERPALLDSASNMAAAIVNDEGDYAKAEKFLSQAVALQQTYSGPEDPRLGDALQNLASLAMMRGDYAKAEPLFRRALTLQVRLVGWTHPDVANILLNHAALEMAVHKPLAALDDLERGGELQEQIIGGLLRVGSQREKKEFFSTLDDSTRRLVSAHTRSMPADARACRLALTTILRRKGRVLDASLDTLQAVRRQALPADVVKIERIQEIASQRGRLLRGADAGGAPGRLAADMAGLQAESDRLEKELGDRYVPLRRSHDAITIEAVQRRLPAGAALVELLRYTPLDNNVDGLYRRGQPRYVAYALAAAGPPRWTDLGEAETIDSAVAAVGQAFERADRPVDPKGPAHQLDELVMRPVRALLGNVRDVYLAPDGPLNLVPFAALIDEAGQFLISSYRFTYLSSGRDLLRPPAPPPRMGSLIVAAPDYGPDERCDEKKRPLVRNFADLYFCPLPDMVIEGRQLQATMQKARMVVGQDATEALVKGLRAPAILHLATHGFFLGPNQAAMASDQPPGAERGIFRVSSQGPAPAVFDEPLLQSGLALAGANRRGGGGDDGILTALEVAGLDLLGTKLVVLSACQTGAGTPIAGDGVYGLRRSFFLAGAEAQVMSLWNVKDEATRRLMVDYHQRLAAGAGRVEALRQAQLAFLASPSTAHPFFWAAFIAAGSNDRL